MANSIQIRSFNQILGDMIRTIIAETPLNDLNAGSVLLTLLEAAAANDFENNAAILNVLELLNIDAVKNNDLDARAGDYGLTRNAAIKASGLVNILNTNITKQSTSLYVIKAAPISGQTTLFVNNTTGWASSGTLYVGRGTQSFEGPIPYTSITVFPTYSQINLGSALQKDHLISDTVINSQGQPDQIIAAGTVVNIPANNQNPEIQYITLRDAVIPSGEDSVIGVAVIALVAGSQGNAGINTITKFDTPPFSGAGVTNSSSFSNGLDIETDTQLRNRIKSYAITLARGTAAAIVDTVIGVSDPDESKQVASAVITEPVKVGDPSILYIDDGSGLQPSYAGQSVDTMLTNATGKESFLQLANYPVTRPQVINTLSGPFNINPGSFLRVSVDGASEDIQFNADQFVNISAATIAEIIVVINDTSELFNARFVNNSQFILIYPINHAAEIIQVAPIALTDDPTLYVNSLLKFPTDEFSYISLYRNATRLHEQAKNAHVETVGFASWNVTADGNLIISVDDTPAQDRPFALSDFVGAPSYASLTLTQWVDVFNTKFAGLTATATSNQTMLITSNKIGSLSAINVEGGTLLSKMFPNLPLTSVGQTSDFALNRQTGNLEIYKVFAGDTISAGVIDAKGFDLSAVTTSGVYNVASDASGRPSEIVVVADSNFCDQRSVPLLVGSTLNITNPGADSHTMRIMSSTLSAFANVTPGDFIYLVKRSSGWLNVANTGLYKVKARGGHTTPGVDSFVDVDNDGVVTQAGVSVLDSTDIKAFGTDGFPQIWRGVYLSNPPSSSITDIIDSFNTDLINVKASLFNSNSIKLTSTTERGGSIAVPVAVSNASLLFPETASAQFGNPPHIANRVSSKDLVSLFKRTPPVSTNVWLNRHTYSDLKGLLSADAVPDPFPYAGTYSEIVTSAQLTSANVSYDDYLSFTRGNNRNQFRNVKALISTNSVGTQEGTARTELDHIINDEFQLVKPLQLSTDDSIVIIMDENQKDDTIDIQMARTGQVNSGSGGSFIPTNTEFSADDADNEPGINFSNTTYWGTTINNTDFSDYAVWMRARNWYASGGIGSGQGEMLVRATQYGPNGNSLRFSIAYPTSVNQAATTTFLNTPSFSQYTYFFASGAARPIAITPSVTTIAVKGPYPNASTNFPNGTVSSGNYFDYTFSSGTFTTVAVGDVLSITNGSGVSPSNSGAFRVDAKSGNTVRVFNPGASVTSVGGPEIDTVVTVADVVGTHNVYTINTVADSGGSLNQKYFIIYDSVGSVAVWYDLNNVGAAPPAAGTNRYIKVSSVVTGETAANVAIKTGQAISLDNAFTVVGVVGNQITINANINGTFPSATAGTSGFTTATAPGTPNNSVNGRYFIIYDAAGSVAVWYDVNNQGTPEPFHGANRSIRVGGVISGNSAITVASATVAALNLDLSFTASNVSGTSSTITITNTFNGNVPNPLAGTSGFSVSSTNGSLPASELVTNTNLLVIFPITGTDVASIVTTINGEQIIEAVAVGNPALLITRSTSEEDYTYAGNSTALAFGHNPTVPATRGSISLYDGEGWVKAFANSNPNFILKNTLTLNGIAPSIYSMDTAPNVDLTTGEYFKLIPTTIKNAYHHMTQKAISQLPIVANVSISDDRKNVQIDSKMLGSAGAIEVVGGNANKAQAYALNESEIDSDINGSNILIKIPAFPDTFNVGDFVMLQNDSGVRRLSRLGISDSINVTIPSANNVDYNYNPKVINVTAGTTFTITDVSGTYGRAAGFVWRWTHGGGVTLSAVNAGDQVFAFGPTLSWDQGNKPRLTGDGAVAGLPIVSVNDTLNYFDVVNPYGKAMTSTAVGSGNTVQICPTPIIRWNLAHAGRVPITSMGRIGSTVTVTTPTPHFLHAGDSVDIVDSNFIPDGTYTSVTIISVSQFTFTLAGSAFTETDAGASLIKTGLIPTRYRVEKLGFNNMVRISRYDGASPMFIDSGVAVDDYVVISGSTFSSNNNGIFRVTSVDNNSIMLVNSSATDQLNTIRPFNNQSLEPTWTSNTNVITGVAGTFKYLSVGSWVKKKEDPDSFFRQVTGFSPGTPATATQITIGSNYPGSSAIAPGVSFDELNDYDKGVVLQSADDLAIYEGDAAITGDLLSIQNIINPSWFSVANIGNFVISVVGTDPATYKPFVRIVNPAGLAESARLIAVNLAGFYITESLVNRYYSVRQVTHAVMDDLNPNRRSIYMQPDDRSYKFGVANATSLLHQGKLGYSTDVTTGIDGYLYYTGLLRRVQRIVDGFEPDQQNFPGRRAVGAFIETLPPLVKRIKISISVTTGIGVNLGDISNNIKSVIINYVQTLGVGQDVILSEIITQVMGIKGVAAVTFTNPAPSTERITIGFNERADVIPEDIGIA